MQEDTINNENPAIGNVRLPDVLLIFRNYRAWKHWRKIKSGIKTRDFKRGCGYYITVGLFNYNPIGKVVELEMKSGKIGLYELLDYQTYSDPNDMVKESNWHFIGYKGEKAIKDCSFSEALSLYFH